MPPPLPLQPPMPPGPPPEWPQALWIGVVDVHDALPERIPLAGATGYRRARLLVRSGRWPCGFVELDISDGSVALSDLRRGLSVTPGPGPGPAAADPPPAVTVVLCTRDRPEPLRGALASLLDLAHPDFEIVVVDNASRSDAAAKVVASLGDPRVRLVVEERPGLARARNAGMLAASHDIVAFTDDDVVADRWWLRGLADGFAAGPDVACVCGMVPSAEVRSFPQAYFDARVTWARSCAPRRYRLADPPADQPLFPFQVGSFGTGANFAVRRPAILRLGGFDEALGVGSKTRGGEDIDMFLRVLLAGHDLVYQPTALVWHRHRTGMDSLRDQISGYGLGLGAWITKLLLSRRTAGMVLQRSVGGVRHARQMTRVAHRDGTDVSDVRAGNGLRMTELWSLVRGPMAYGRARLSGARATPLRGVAALSLDRSRATASRTHRGAE